MRWQFLGSLPRWKFSISVRISHPFEVGPIVLYRQTGNTLYDLGLSGGKAALAAVLSEVCPAAGDNMIKGTAAGFAAAGALPATIKVRTCMQHEPVLMAVFAYFGDSGVNSHNAATTFTFREVFCW
jgi:hypothetical protein